MRGERFALSGGEIVVDVEEGKLGRARYPDFGAERPDLVLSEPFERLAVVPDVSDPDAIVGLGDPVEQTSWSACAAGREAHLLDEAVVLVERCALEVQNHTHGHEDPPSLKTSTKAQPTRGVRTHASRKSGGITAASPP